jgi:hypothetical protein
MDPEYPAIRPRIAAWLSAAALAAALATGVGLIQSLREAAAAVRRGAQAATLAHSYASGLDAWDAASGVAAPRESVRADLTVQFRELRADLADSGDVALIDRVITGLRASDEDISAGTRTAMVAFLGRQDAMLFSAAEAAQRAQRYATVLLAFAALAAGVLFVPMVWLWLRHPGSPTP